MPAEQTDYEARIRVLERLVAQLQRMLRNALEMARRALEMAQQGQGGGGGGGAEIYTNCLVTTPIPAPASSAAVAPFGFVQVRKMDPNTGAFSVHPRFPDPVKTFNGWPGSTTTATNGKVVSIAYEDGSFRLLEENCA